MPSHLRGEGGKTPVTITASPPVHREAAAAAAAAALIIFTSSHLTQSIMPLQLIESSSDCSGSVDVPEEFLCPIGLEIMEHPVMNREGRNFDRKSILDWLNAGNLTCPLTRKPLKPSELVPNHQLELRIRMWRMAHEEGYRTTSSSDTGAESKTAACGDDDKASSPRFVGLVMNDTSPEPKEKESAYRTYSLMRNANLMPSLRDLESPIRTSSQIGGRRRQRGNGSPRAPSSVIQQDNSSSSSDDDGMMDLLEEMFNEVMEIANDTYEELDAAQAAAVASA